MYHNAQVDLLQEGLPEIQIGTFICGLEANYRRLIYTVDGNYDTLEKLFKETKTMNDLSKWNNLSYKILK